MNEEGGLQSQPGLLEDTFHRTTQNNTDMKSARELVLALSSPDLKIRSVLLRILLDANASPAVLPPNNRRAVLLRILLDANASPAVLPPNNRRAVLLRILLDANASPAVFPPSNRETVLRKSKAQFKKYRNPRTRMILTKNKASCLTFPKPPISLNVQNSKSPWYKQ